MSGGWRSYLGGRYSPFTAAPPQHPVVTDADFHYLGPEDIVDPPRHESTSQAYFPRHGSRADAEDPRAPDILIMKHRGTTYPLHFPAFSIGEGYLRVGELRRYAAEKTGAGNPNRVKLLYKGRMLKDDAIACREEGLKQNSELMCVVSETPAGGQSEEESSGESASEDDLRDDRGPRVDVDGSIIGGSSGGRKKKHRSSTTKKTRRHEDEPAPYPSAATNSVPSAASSAPPIPRATEVPPRPQTTQPPQNNQPPPPRQAATPQPPPPASNLPKTAMDKLNEISGVFREKFQPLAEAYIRNPPSDPKIKNQEYMKLSESILAQIIFKLDGVETDGDQDARAQRKALVKETQETLSRLDEVGKPKDENEGRSAGSSGRKKGRR